MEGNCLVYEVSKMMSILSKVKSFFKKTNDFGVSKKVLNQLKRVEVKTTSENYNEPMELALAAYEGLRIYDSHLDPNFENPTMDSFDISFPSPVD
jgi:rRNA-processing protein FCF1